jgi:alginate export protein
MPRMQLLRLCILAMIAGTTVVAQDTSRPIRIGDASLSGSIRARVEDWHWFDARPAEKNYTYGAAVLRLNLGRTGKRMDWQVDATFPLFVNLPRNAVASEPQGPVGYGGDYFLVNGKRNIAAASLRQAFLTMKSADARWRLRMGRFEFADGAEAVPPDPNLAALKRDRINQRLIATFSYALRSFDGALVTYDRPHSNLTAVAARLVEGSFQLRAFKEIDVDLYYGAYSRYFSGVKASTEARLFLLHYHDGRSVSKVDNRPQHTLDMDRQPIRLTTPGAHLISSIPVGPGTAELLVWGAGQFGQWGSQAHSAAEIAAETAYRFSTRMQPSIRVGYFRSTGDGNPNDTHHNTFFQVLSTPRAYAKLPFYILMNVDDRFLQLRAAATSRLALRSEVHSVRLSNARDLWYDGGGAFQRETFGYLGRPSGSSTALGTSLDLGADYTLSSTTTLSLYGGIMRGDAVPAFVFPFGGQRPVVHLLSIEVIHRF